MNLNRLGVILGVSLVIASVIFSASFYKSRFQEDSLSVTGSARQHVTSDTVKWVMTIVKTVPAKDLKTGYSDLAIDLKEVKKFYASHGFDEKTLTISPATMYQNYDYNYQNISPSDRYYNIQQNIELNSNEVQKVSDLTKNLQDLIDKNIIINNQTIEYFYSKLPELRVALLSEAVKDARVRAEKIAESGNRKVNSLKSAGMGVVQLLPINSVDVSDYGSYDTQNIEKEAMITVKTTFGLK